MAIVVELLSRGGKPMQHFVFDKTEIRIGRDYDNDIHLDDPFVDPHHLVISQSPQDDAVHFRDCQSLNGTRRNGKVSLSGVLSAEDKIKLGRSRLRVFATGSDITPTLKLSAMEEKTEWLSNLSLAIGLMLVFGLFLLIGDYLESFKEFKLLQEVPKVILQMMAVSIWPLTFALLSKLNRKEARLVTQFNLLWLFLLLLAAVGVFERILRFNLSATSALDWLGLVVISVLLWSFAWFSLFIAFHQPDRKRRILASIICFLFVMPMGYYMVYQKDNFSTRPAYSRILLPPAYRIAEPVNTEAFLQQANTLFEQASEAAQKP